MFQVLCMPIAPQHLGLGFVKAENSHRICSCFYNDSIALCQAAHLKKLVCHISASPPSIKQPWHPTVFATGVTAETW